MQGYLPTMVYTLLYTPGYTSPAPHPAPVQAPRHREDRLTALRRVLAELTISDAGVSVLPRSSLFHHPFHCWPVVAVLSVLPKNAVGREACCAEWTSPIHHPFHCWATFRTSPVSPFCQFMRESGGYTRGVWST